MTKIDSFWQKVLLTGILIENSAKSEIFDFPFHLETLLTVGEGGVDDANCVSHVSDNETRLEKAYSSIISHYTCSYPFLC